MPSDIKSYLALEASLAGRFRPYIRKLSKKVGKNIGSALDEGNFIGAHIAINSIDLSDATEGHHKYIEYITLASLLFGAGRLGPEKESELYKTKKRPDIFDSAVRQFKASIALSGETWKGAIRTEINKIERAANASAYVQKAEKIRDLTSYVTETLRETGDGLIDMTSSLHTSRLANYGYTVEALVRGTDSYVIDEQLDSRTCPLCQLMHGTVFSVERAHSKLDRLLRIDSPADLKALAPFPRQAKADIARYQTMTAGELTAIGMDTPPYHPRCRGLLTHTEASFEVDAIITSTAARSIIGTALIGSVEAVLD